MMMTDRNRQHSDRPRIIAAGILPALFLAALLGGCSTTVFRQPAPPELAGFEAVQIPEVDLLRVSPGMRAFADRYAKRTPADSGKAWMLAYAALDPYLLEFEYDPMVTLPADEAYRLGRGNCLTFSGMFIAMAREAGLDAWFQEVIVPPEWSAVNETLLVSKHVNAIVADRGKRYVIDVSRRQKSPLEVARKMSDEEALAQFYNNRGADALLSDDLARSHAYFKKALKAEPELAYVWSNLGVVFRRNGQTADAIRAYRIALDLAPDESVALNNLHALYEEEGDTEAAADLASRVEKNRRRNPYYLHYLAELANEEQRWSDALDLLNRAIRLEAREYRFFYTRALTQYHAGRPEAARADLARAHDLAPVDVPHGNLTLPDGS
jgi:tetratricopeptide (TPR) repeat protein